MPLPFSFDLLKISYPSRCRCTIPLSKRGLIGIALNLSVAFLFVFFSYLFTIIFMCYTCAYISMLTMPAERCGMYLLEIQLETYIPLSAPPSEESSVQIGGG